MFHPLQPPPEGREGMRRGEREGAKVRVRGRRGRRKKRGKTYSASVNEPSYASTKARIEDVSCSNNIDLVRTI